MVPPSPLRIDGDRERLHPPVPQRPHQRPQDQLVPKVVRPKSANNSDPSPHGKPTHTPPGYVSLGLEGEDDSDPSGSPGPAIVTMHPVENIHRRDRREALVDVVEAMAATVPVRWVMHGHTERALSGDARPRMEAAGVELVPLKPRGEFLEMVSSAPFVITDGGSIQEECVLLGVPTLLWRDCSERPDGLGKNIVLSRYDRDVVDDFLRDPQQHRRPRQLPEVSPTAQILTELAEWQ